MVNPSLLDTVLYILCNIIYFTARVKWLLKLLRVTDLIVSHVYMSQIISISTQGSQ